MKCPCRDCEKRKVGCHGTCPEYKEWAEENDRLRKQRQEIERNNNLFYGNSKPVRRRR